MKITSAEFVKSVVKLEDLPKDNFPEIAFVGRSNVGKSSLLNALMKKKIGLHERNARQDPRNQLLSHQSKILFC